MGGLTSSRANLTWSGLRLARFQPLNGHHAPLPNVCYCGPLGGPSMADHLRGLSGRSRPDFREPLPSSERLQAMFDRHQSDVTLEEFLQEICAARPDDTAVATFPLILDSGDYFQGVSTPRIMDSLIHDNRNNEAFKRLLSDHAYGAIEKRRGGGLRVLVRTEEAQKALLGVEVSALGRRFRFALESPLAKCYFVDVVGLDTSTTATEVLRALAGLGAKPVYFRPVAYDKVSGLCSTTWRYYFPGEEAPASLLRDGALRSYIRVERSSYRCFGKNDPTGGRSRRNRAAPRAGSGQQPLRVEASAVHSPRPPVTILQRPDSSSPSIPVRSVPEAPASSVHSPPAETMARTDHTTAAEPLPSGTGQTQLVPQGDGAVTVDDNVAMLEQVTGGKRAHTPPISPPQSPIIRTANRFSALDDFDGEADLQMAMDGESSIFQLVPCVTEGTKMKVAKRCKSKRSKHSNGHHEADSEDALATILRSLNETTLTAQAAVDANAVAVATRHLESVKRDLTRAKSAETVLGSLIASPQTWQMVLREENALLHFEECISLHALNRQLLCLPNTGTTSFTARLKAANWHSTGSRSQLIDTITTEIGTSAEGQSAWQHARCVSLFELLLIPMANHIFRDDEWMAILLGSTPAFLQRKGLRLLSEPTLRLLVSSSFGHTIVTESLVRMPGLPTLVELSKLQASQTIAWVDLALTGVAPETQDEVMTSDRS